MMKRTVKNEKVIRAMTIGLATMIAASSAPINVYADDEISENPDTSSEVTDNAQEDSAQEESHEEPTTEAGEASETIGEAVEIIGESNVETPDTLPTEGCIPAIENAVEAVEATLILDEEGNVSDPYAADKTEIITLLDNSAATEQGKEDDSALANIKEAKADLENAKDYIDTASNNVEEITNNADSEYNKQINAANDDIRNINDSVNEFNEAVNNNDMTAAKAAYDSATVAAEKAEEEYEAAKAEFDKAVAALDDANQAVEDAKGNTKDAQDRLAAAQAKVDALYANVKDYEKNYEQNLEKLEEIEKQYYLMMVAYFRLTGGGYKRVDGKVEYTSFISEGEDKGKLDIDQTAANYIEKYGTDRTQYFAEHFGNANLMGLGRYITKLLVEQMLGSDENIESIQFGKDGNDLMKKATVKKNSYGNDDVAYEEVGKIKWNSSGKNFGRDNYVEVTYFDKSLNETVTKKYNYVLKNPGETYQEENDIENGIFYLAEINENGVNRIYDANNFDNYGKLLDTIAKLQEYNAANKALKEAQDEVTALQDKLAELNKITIASDALNAIRLKLDLAKERVEEIKEYAENIVIPEETPATVAEEGSNNTAETETEVATTDTAATVLDAGSATVTIPGGFDLSTFTLPAAYAADEVFTAANGTASGVLGERTGVAEDKKEDFASYVKKVAEKKPVVKVNNKKINKKLVKIEDNEIPLADMPFEDDSEMNLWWLLLIALFGAAGKKMYDDHKKKQEEANVA